MGSISFGALILLPVGVPIGVPGIPGIAGVPAEIAVGAAAGVVFRGGFVEIRIGKIGGLGGRVPGIRVVEVLNHGGVVQLLRHGTVLYGLPTVLVIIAVPFIVIEVALVIIGPVVDAVVAPGGGLGGLAVSVDQALTKVICPQRAGIGHRNQMVLCKRGVLQLLRKL